MLLACISFYHNESYVTDTAYFYFFTIFNWCSILKNKTGPIKDANRKKTCALSS